MSSPSLSGTNKPRKFPRPTFNFDLPGVPRYTTAQPAQPAATPVATTATPPAATPADTLPAAARTLRKPVGDPPGQRKNSDRCVHAGMSQTNPIVLDDSSDEAVCEPQVRQGSHLWTLEHTPWLNPGSTLARPWLSPGSTLAQP